MTDVGRNDPCPCGSGKKYKKCCLAAEREGTAAQFASAVRRGLDWLVERHPLAVEAAMAELYARFDRRIATATEELPDYVFDTMSAAAAESLLAEAELPTEVGRRTAWQLLGEPGGPLLASEEREVLRELGTRPLRLYTVAEVDAGCGLRLVDALSQESAAVEERTASRELEPGDALGARLLHRAHGATLSGFLLPFPRNELQRLREKLRRRERRIHELPPAEGRRQMGELLLDAWLEMVVRRAQLPAFVDAGSGETIVLATDHYRVRDWQALDAALVAQPDVERNAGEGWTRLDHGAGGRVLCSLARRRGDRLEVFTRTTAGADAARRWLESIAADLVTFRAREVVDPREAARRPKAAGESRGPAREAAPIELAPEEVQALHERLYADWAEQPIPALGGKTPRQARRSKLGRERVVELLLAYEHDDRQQARAEGRPPIDYGFLWRAVGLERPEP